ncbi:hypothetical protein DGN16_12035 [Xanthomonas citri pv. fuscans]|uniref:Uncharacterized protein n=1 Tax=Xanthomonas citri pv. phaseoli var. fuscans TaxID=473423 RepID=A0A808FJY6_XANCI|nr:hypothetical protein DGN16_12035 [Xanthomonas citri pv. fuscans]QWN07862.1 hypothetical protein DGN11_10865 [Xanthomonas citri pv. fuscans]QWN12451.1 hypothetical protein DGN07_13630 [Xanthomonas citri pv. fuscans]
MRRRHPRPRRHPTPDKPGRQTTASAGPGGERNRFQLRHAREGLINSPQMRDTTVSCRGLIHAADVR